MFDNVLRMIQLLHKRSLFLCHLWDYGRQSHRDRRWLAQSCTTLAEPGIEGKPQQKYQSEVVIGSTTRRHAPVWRLSSLWQEGGHEQGLKDEKVMCVVPMQIVDPEKDMIEIEQKILYPWSFNTIWAQRKHFLLVNLIGTLDICTLARRPM